MIGKTAPFAFGLAYAAVKVVAPEWGHWMISLAILSLWLWTRRLESHLPAIPDGVERWRNALLWAGTTAVAVSDIWTPLGVHHGSFYVVIVLGCRSRRSLLTFSVVGAALTLGLPWLVPMTAAAAAPIYWANRLISVMLMILTAVVVHRIIRIEKMANGARGHTPATSPPVAATGKS